jgi:RecA-family ATPase
MYGALMERNDPFWNLDYYSGENLEKLADICRDPRKALIEGLAYENAAYLYYAKDGVGKSLLLFQAICEASNQLPVFGYFNCPKPLKTLWIQSERNVDEIGERLQRFGRVFKPNYSNIIVTDKLQGSDLKSVESRNRFIEMLDKITNQAGGFDLIVLDPIYALVSGELTSDDAASYITRFSTALQNRYNASVIVIHHSNRGSRIAKTGERTGEDLYGNRFLSAHFSGIFKIARLQTGSGSEFICEKDSHSTLISKFKLNYDPENFVSSIDDTSVTKTDKIAHLLRQYRSTGKTFTIYEIMSTLQVSRTTINEVMSVQFKKGFVDTGKSIDRKKLYKSELE